MKPEWMNDQRCQWDLVYVVALFNPVVGLQLVNLDKCGIY